MRSNYAYIVDTKLVAYYLVQRKTPITEIFSKISYLLHKLQKRGDIYLCFDIGHSDFREAEQSYYKGHRREQMKKKSQAEQDSHELFNKTYEGLVEIFKHLNVYTLAVPGVEADDLASLIVEQNKDKKITLITGDYDWYHMVVENSNVRMYDFPKDSFVYKHDIAREYDITTRREFSVRKSITGDKSDNIKLLKFMAEGKGKALFDDIMETYDDPSDDTIIQEIEKYAEEHKRLVVHPFHLEDGRTTIREAFTSNMRIADPFTSVEQLTEDQLQVFNRCITAKGSGTTENKFNELCIKQFGYPVILHKNARRIYGIN